MSTVATLPKPASTGAPWSAGEIVALQRRIDAILNAAPALRGAHVGLVVSDALTRTVLYSRDADGEFIPASNLKLVTGSAALARLGSAFRFHTEAITCCAAVDGTLRGTLVLRGGGDALLRSRDLDGLVSALTTAGISNLGGPAGGIAIDASYFDPKPYPAGWVWDDYVYDYGAPVSAASYEENAVHIKVSPGANPGDPARVTANYGMVGEPFEACPAGLGVRIVPQAKTGARDSQSTLDLSRDPAGCILVTGAAPLGAKPETLDAAVVSPAEYLRAALLDKLQTAGITLTPATPAPGEPPPSASPQSVARNAKSVLRVWSHDSEPLPQLLADFWYPSDNLIGEVLLKAMGVSLKGEPGTTDNGLAAETAFLRSAGVDTATVQLFDGSGLSRYNRMTPRSLVALLLYDWRAPWRDTILNALPVAGVRGTLAHAYAHPPVARRVFAKTGGMLNVTNLSGYVAPLHHGAVAFSFLIDDAFGDDTAIATLREQVLRAVISSGPKT